MFDCLYKEKKRCAFDGGVLVLSQKNSSLLEEKICAVLSRINPFKSQYIFLILYYSGTESKKF